MIKLPSFENAALSLVNAVREKVRQLISKVADFLSPSSRSYIVLFLSSNSKRIFL